MAVRPKGKAWQVDVTWRGQRAPRVSRPTKAEAEAVEAQFLADLKAGRTPTLTRGVASRAHRSSVATMGQLLDYTVRHRWAGMKSEKSSEMAARLCVEHLGADMRPSEITSDTILAMAEEWAAQGNANGTINRKLAALRVMLGVAVEKGEITEIPKWTNRKEYEGRLRWFTSEEVRSLLSFHSGDQRLCDMIVLGVDTGFRLGELHGLKVKDFSVATGMLTAWETKGNLARSVPLTPRAKAVVMRLRGHRPDYGHLLKDAYTSKQIGDRMAGWKKFMGLPEDDPACFHTTRHTCCSRLVQNGVSLPVVQKWMGHKDIKTTMRYAHLAPNAFEGALEVLSKGEDE